MSNVIFQISNLYIIPIWFLMIFIPRWSFTEKLVRNSWVYAPLAVFYLVLVVPQLSTALPVLMKPELGPIATLLSTPEGATLGWIHFLIFDLWVAQWIYTNSLELKLNQVVTSLILVTTLMLGPVGWLLGMLWFQWKRRQSPREV